VCLPRASLPMRERGSKPLDSAGRSGCSGSLPMRERGSKLRESWRPRRRQGVAPYAGARIETFSSNAGSARTFGRSLCGSADRNCSARLHRYQDSGSLPMRERGSKRAVLWDRRQHVRSLPMRERGSKWIRGGWPTLLKECRSHGGTWMEMRLLRRNRPFCPVASRAKRGSKHLPWRRLGPCPECNELRKDWRSLRNGACVWSSRGWLCPTR
jgi:hypothetical protein